MLACGCIGNDWYFIIIFWIGGVEFLCLARDSRFIDSKFDILYILVSDDKEAVIDDMIEFLNITSFKFYGVVGLLNDSGVDIERVDLNILVIL